MLTVILYWRVGRRNNLTKISVFSEVTNEQLMVLMHEMSIFELRIDITNWGMSKEIGPLNPEYMGVIGENIASSVFSECKVMVEVIDEFTFSVLKKHKKHVVKMAQELLKNETIVYEEIKSILPARLENSLDCSYS